MQRNKRLQFFTLSSDSIRVIIKHSNFKFQQKNIPFHNATVLKESG